MTQEQFDRLVELIEVIAVCEVNPPVTREWRVRALEAAQEALVTED